MIEVLRRHLFYFETGEESLQKSDKRIKQKITRKQLIKAGKHDTVLKEIPFNIIYDPSFQNFRNTRTPLIINP